MYCYIAVYISGKDANAPNSANLYTYDPGTYKLIVKTVNNRNGRSFSEPVFITIEGASKIFRGL